MSRIFNQLIYSLILMGSIFSALTSVPGAPFAFSHPELRIPAVAAQPLADPDSPADLDDSPETLPSYLPQIAWTQISGLPLQQSSIRLQTFAVGVLFGHLSRPPPC